MRTKEMNSVALSPTAGISLCSGIGGLDSGIRAALGNSYRTVCYVEGEAHAAATLVARMQDKSLCHAPIWSDVKSFNGHEWRDKVDLVIAGYPCQPFSVAGLKKGTADERHLWPYIANIISDIKPRWVFCENVPGHINIGLREVLKDLEALGYGVAAGLFSAQECGAPHIRQRLFFLADTHSNFLWKQSRSTKAPVRQEASKPADDGGSKLVANTNGYRQQGRWAQQSQPQHATAQVCSQSVADTQHRDLSVGLSKQNRTHSRQQWTSRLGSSWWAAEPDVGRVAHGISRRMDRLRALGNAVVPAVAQKAFITLLNAHRASAECEFDDE